MPAVRLAQKGCIMIGYTASFVPLAKGSYRFTMLLWIGDQAVADKRTVKDVVVDEVAAEDVEMAFLGSVVEYFSAQIRAGGQR